MSTEKNATTITEHEAGQVERANASGRSSVVFVHGLWLLPSSWDRWATLFEEAGYVAVTPGWPDDTEILAGRGLAAVSVAIDPAPFRGVLPLPISALRSGKPVLGNPANRHRAIQPGPATAASDAS
jgi:non-heme chloroperoxidase